MALILNKAVDHKNFKQVLHLWSHCPLQSESRQFQFDRSPPSLRMRSRLHCRADVHTKRGGGETYGDEMSKKMGVTDRKRLVFLSR